MSKVIVFSTLLFFSQFSNSQTVEQSTIFLKILENNIRDSKSYLACEQATTFFDSSQFNSETGLEVPFEILKELEQSSKQSKGGSWHQKIPIKFEYVRQFLKSEDCLEKIEIERLFEKNHQRHQVFLVSEPIFDNDFEHCIVSLLIMSQKGSSYGNSYFLKKVYGSWTVISVFDVWGS